MPKFPRIGSRECIAALQNLDLKLSANAEAILCCAKARTVALFPIIVKSALERSRDF